jgi:hypothetical protein
MRPSSTIERSQIGDSLANPASGSQPSAAGAVDLRSSLDGLLPAPAARAYHASAGPSPRYRIAFTDASYEPAETFYG